MEPGVILANDDMGMDEAQEEEPDEDEGEEEDDASGMDSDHEE